MPPEDERRLEWLRRAAWALDSAFPVPGTSLRVGLDPILGLVPGLGDAVPPLLGVVMLWQAYRLGVPRLVQVRMFINTAVDAVIGFVPVAGDLFDLTWKANLRNLALLELHAYEVRRSSTGDRLFVCAVIAGLLAALALPVLLLVWLARLLAGALMA